MVAKWIRPAGGYGELNEVTIQILKIFYERHLIWSNGLFSSSTVNYWSLPPTHCTQYILMAPLSLWTKSQIEYRVSHILTHADSPSQCLASPSLLGFVLTHSFSSLRSFPLGVNYRPFPASVVRSWKDWALKTRARTRIQMDPHLPFIHLPFIPTVLHVWTLLCYCLLGTLQMNLLASACAKLVGSISTSSLNPWHSSFNSFMDKYILYDRLIKFISEC